MDTDLVLILFSLLSFFALVALWVIAPLRAPSANAVSSAPEAAQTATVAA
jgi:hypothetical protein